MRLDLRVDLPHKTVEAQSTLEIRSLRPLAQIAFDAVDFEVKAIRISGHDDKAEKPPSFSHDGQKLVIDLDPAWPAGREATLQIDYRVREPKDGLFFFGPTATEPDVPFTVWSQGESITNRYWFPCLDHPNQRQSTELVVTVADGFEVLSNGKLVERKANPDKTVTFHWKQDQPHAAYLVTLVVGKFEVVREEWHNIPVLYYVPKDRKDEVARTFGRTREMLDFFSRRFGVEYPWDKYAQVVVEQFTAGGMENTSATTLTDRVLHDERSLLDDSPDSLIAHELAHQWWGDLLTCRDWAHIWLNEGFASYAEALWAEHDKGADEYAYTMLHKARSAIAGGKDRPIVDRHYAFPDAMFDSRAYPKGAWVLHMLRQRLGDEVFFRCLQRYATEHRLQSVETSDLRKSIEMETGRSMERFFYDWTERPGSPALEITTEYLPETKLERVVIKQTQAAEAFQFPLTLRFQVAGTVNGDGPAPAKQVVQDVDVTEKEHMVYVPLPGRPVLVEVDPRQAVLAEIKENKGRELWVAQLTEAADVAARVRAAQHFGQSKTPPDREVLAKALPADKFWGVRVEIAAALGESGGDVCRDALLQGLKDPEARVRRACVEQLGKFPHDAAAAAALKEVLRKGDPAYGVEAAALKAYAQVQQPDTIAVLLPWLAKPSHNEVLRTAALGGLGESRDLSCLDVLLDWTRRSKPRDCRAAAMRALARLALTGNPTDEQRQKMVTAALACLDGEGPRLRQTAVAVLEDLGRAAAPGLPELEAISLHDPSDRIRSAAHKAVEQIRSNQPAPVELTRLREELDRMKQAQDKLQDRLKQFEKVEHKGGE
jgi:aminopeptidase N